MGVPTFYKWLSVRYPRLIIPCIEEVNRLYHGEWIKVDITQKNPNGMEFDNLYLDMNGIIHKCTHPENEKQPATEAEMMSNIFEYIDRLMSIVRPRRLLYMAIDGVAPRAKLNQQRMRRFKTAEETSMAETVYHEVKEDFIKDGRTNEIPLPPNIWDSNVITPGTAFMERLSHSLRYYIQRRFAQEPGWKNLEVILSDSNAPGEGEHKIMQYIRSQRTQENYNPNLYHCLNGQDADLIMLGLATHEAHFYILREEVISPYQSSCSICGKVGHLAAECDITETPRAESVFDTDYKSSQQKSTPLQFLSLPILREYLEEQLAQESEANFQFDFEKCIDDFVMLCFFVGNDFLPHLPGLSISSGSIDMMLTLYVNILSKLKGYLTNEGEINALQIKEFVRHLSKIEASLFEENARKQAERERKRCKDSNFTDERQRMAQMESEDENQLAAEFLRPFISVKESFNNVVKQKMDKLKAVENPRDEVQLGIGHAKDWRKKYYTYKFQIPDDDVAPFVSEVSHEYIRGLQWVLRYYYQGVCSWSWYYPYHYAPLSSDLINGLHKPIGTFQMDAPFKPSQQLMSVLPPRSIECIPFCFRDLMLSPSSTVIDFYPTTFDEDQDGKRFKWQWIIKLPFIDQERLFTAMRLYENLMTSEEITRDERSYDYLFVHKNHPFSEQLNMVNQLSETQIIDTNVSNGMVGSLSPDKYVVAPSNYVSTVDLGSLEGFKSMSISACICKVPEEHHRSALLDGVKYDRIMSGETQAKESLSNVREWSFNAGAMRRIILHHLNIKVEQPVPKFHHNQQYMVNHNRDYHQTKERRSVKKHHFIDNHQLYQNSRMMGKDPALPVKSYRPVTSSNPAVAHHTLINSRPIGAKLFHNNFMQSSAIPIDKQEFNRSDMLFKKPFSECNIDRPTYKSAAVNLRFANLDNDLAEASKPRGFVVSCRKPRDVRPTPYSVSQWRLNDRQPIVNYNDRNPMPGNCSNGIGIGVDKNNQNSNLKYRGNYCNEQTFHNERKMHLIRSYRYNNNETNRRFENRKERRI